MIMLSGRDIGTIFETMDVVLPLIAKLDRFRLSPREKDVAVWVIHGCSNHEITELAMAMSWLAAHDRAGDGCVASDFGSGRAVGSRRLRGTRGLGIS
ncbi:MAG: hypothetical protein M0Z84_05620 [Gammaproteobacteria bacterium]|nr:hypothetical protein [Gammaproteobacteria bacterium]